MDRRELLRRGTTGSLESDVRDFEYRRSEGRDLLSGRGFTGLSAKNLSQGGPEAIEAINEMHKQRTGQSRGGGMGNAQVAWPKLRDPFEQFREKAWWFLKEGDFSQSLKKIREWSSRYGTLVCTMSGVEEIQNIKVGDQVLTHKGRYRKVTATWNREDDTTLWTIKPHYILPFEFTEGHKIWIRRDDVEQWVPIQEITTTDEVFVPVDKTVIDKDSVSVWETLNKEEWIVAENNHIERKSAAAPMTCIESQLSSESIGQMSPTIMLNQEADVVQNLYLDQGWSTLRIAEQYGTTKKTVSKWLKVNGIEIRSKEDRSKAASVALMEKPKSTLQPKNEVLGGPRGRPRIQDEGPCTQQAVTHGLCQLHYGRRKADGTLPDVLMPSGYESEGSLADEMFGKKVKDLSHDEFNAYSLEIYHRRHGKNLLEDGLVEEGSILRRNQKNANYSPLPTEFEVDEDLLWLMGIFVAEGSTAEGKKVHWDFNRKEVEYAERVKKVLSQKFGIDAHIREKQNSKGQWLVVESSSVPLNAWFREMLGVKAWNKHFPEWAMFLPNEKAAWLLRGYFDGDGSYVAPKQIRAGTTSPVLTSQVQRLIQRANIAVSVRAVKPTLTRRPTWDITALESDKFGDVIGIHGESSTRRWPIEVVDSGQWVSIETISSEPYKGTVYDLTVEEDFSFVTSVAAHNCRLVYMTHPLVPSLIDIYSRFPLLDIEFKHKDQKLADFYGELFLNQLDYQEFLYDMAREYWTVGEAFALGSWHDGIGA
jgi:intein/homing endonuclease